MAGRNKTFHQARRRRHVAAGLPSPRIATLPIKPVALRADDSFKKFNVVSVPFFSRNAYVLHPEIKEDMSHSLHVGVNPYAPAKRFGDLCACANCGRESPAEYQFSEYPHYFMPTDWSVDSHSVLRCPKCEGNPRTVYMNEYVLSYKDRTQALERSPRVEVDGARRGLSAALIDEDTLHELNQQIAALEERMTKENTMDEKKEESALKVQAKSLGNAALLGAQLGVTQAVGDILLDLARDLGEDVPWLQSALESPEGRELVKLSLALMIHSAATHTRYVPKADLVKKGMEMQVTVASMQLLAGRLGALQGYMAKLATAGEKLAAVEGGATAALHARVDPEVDVEIDEAELEEEVEREIVRLKHQSA